MPLQIVIERRNCARHRALAGVVNRQLCLQTISKPNSSRHRVTGTNEEYCYSEAKIRRSESKCPNFRGIEIWQRLQTIENSDGLLLQGDTPCTHTNFFHFFAMGHAPNYLYVYNPTYSHLATVVVSLIISSFAQPQLHIHQSLFLESTNAHLPILSPILKGK